MLDWYTDLVEEGRGRWFVNVIVSLIIIGALMLIGLLPAEAYGDLTDGNNVREKLLEQMQFWFFIPILTVVGSGALFLGFDLMRDEDGFLGFLRVVIIIFGLLMVLGPSAYNSVDCNSVGVYGGSEGADIIASMFRAVPRIGFFGGVFCGAYYAWIGLTDSEYSFRDYLSPVIPLIAYGLSFALNIGCSNVVIGR